MSSTYHYHAMAQDNQRRIKHVDGLIDVELEISSPEVFGEARSQIAALLEVDSEKITICSLTLLNPSAAVRHGVDEVSA